MILFELLSGIEKKYLYSKLNPEITGICDNSGNVKKGNLFVAIKGLHFNGEDYIDQAIDNGAKAIVAQCDPQKKWLKKIVYIQVNNVRSTLSLLASNYYGNPSEKLKIIGVTGTKGKTTTACYIYDILSALNIKCGLISSVGTRINDVQHDTGLHVSNPEPLVLQKFLSEMVKNKCEYAILEVTSHGLDQSRVDGIKFDVSVLTNINNEHLDYHKTLTKYMDAKLKLFQKSAICILNKDDETYDYFSKKLRASGGKIFSYSFTRDADYLAEIIKEDKKRSVLQINNKIFITNVVGEYNYSNLIAAISVIYQLGFNADQISPILSNINKIEGRLEEVPWIKDIKIYIDFAHTPDSLNKVLKHLSKECKGKLICLFGCAGERDRSKRRIMGEISSKIANYTILTTEDPRSEDVDKIINEIARGCIKSGGVEIKSFDRLSKSKKSKRHYFLKIPERENAIDIAINYLAKDKDVIVLCGKGHEKSMSFEGIEHPYSEKETVKTAIKEKTDVYAVILAAGAGKRMKSNLPKVLLKIAGRPMISYPLRLFFDLRVKKTIIVVNYREEMIKRRLGNFYWYSKQENLRGTADAIRSAFGYLPDKGTVLVVNGDDSAFYQKQTIQKLIDTHNNEGNVITIASANVIDPNGMGRIVRDAKGKVTAIVEEKVADEKIKKIKEINAGVYVFDLKWLKNNIHKIKMSPIGEYYIVDLINLAVKSQLSVGCVGLENGE